MGEGAAEAECFKADLQVQVRSTLIPPLSVGKITFVVGEMHTHFKVYVSLSRFERKNIHAEGPSITSLFICIERNN